MKLGVIFLFSSLLSISSFEQKWTYSSGDNAFDGEYKSASVKGTGGNYPYQHPILVVNYFIKSDQMNIYFTDAGYAGCEKKIAFFKFDNDSIIYKFFVTTNSDKDVWFIEKYSYGVSNISVVELLEKMKNHNKVDVRLSSSCGQNDYQFSLSGSSVAIDFVALKYMKVQKQILTTQKKEEDNRRLLNDSFFLANILKQK